VSSRTVVQGWIALFSLLWVASAWAGPAVSPLLHDFDTRGALERLGVRSTPGIGSTIDLIVSGQMSDADLERRGATIGTRLPDGTRTIRIPVTRFKELRDVPGLARITASYKCREYNDVSVPLSGATPGAWTHVGSGVFTGDTGANVILGEVDSGIDWSHDDFKHPDGTTRILFIWDQAAAGTPPNGYFYGTEWTASQINGGNCTHHDTDGHGTHVMGSAAGDGSGTGNGQPAYKFIGMAPEAGIIVVATDFSIAHIIDGVNYIFTKAAAAGKNAVVNLSLGSQFGAHDGTETFDTSLSALTGPGKILCVAAGNDGNQAIHARQVVPMGGPQTITFSIPTYTAIAGANNDYVAIDAYYPGSANMSVTLTSPPGGTQTVVGPVGVGGSSQNASSLAGYIYVENGATPSPSGDKNVYIEISDQNAARPPVAGTWTITLSPVSTTPSTAFDAWQAQFSLGAAGAAPAFTSDVDETDLVASPGSASEAITAGAYISKVSWPSIDGNNHSFAGLTTNGAIADFSSPGPLRNGAIKPDLAAPGTAIVSTSSSSAFFQSALVNPDGKHHTEAGTSMSSPHVAGAAALLLNAQANQTVAQIKTKLRASATVDAQTGAVPNGTWGYGKLHLSVSSDTQAPSVTVNAPNGGESWAAGSSHDITWTATDNVGVASVTLEYSTNNGASWSPIASGEPNDGTYTWSVAQAASAQMLVRVTAIDGSANQGSDVSNATFTLLDQTNPTASVTSPVGGETFGVGETRAIHWTASDNIAVTSVDLSFSDDGGANWIPISPGEPNDGSYSWLVPDSLTTNALVRVVARDAANNTVTAQSPAVFTIAPVVPPVFDRPTLIGNRPNPFPGNTTIDFGLPAPANVRVRIYSPLGRLVRTVADASFGAGPQSVTWDGIDDKGKRAATGVYLLRFESGGVDQTHRIVLVQ